jgi:hypothetical protein
MMRKLLYSFLFFIFSKSFFKRLNTPSLGLLCVGMFFVVSFGFAQTTEILTGSTFNTAGISSMTVECWGGGGAGGGATDYSGAGGGGGGGAYTRTILTSFPATINYTIGSGGTGGSGNGPNGGVTTFFSVSASGGFGGSRGNSGAGAGGAGGAGGTYSGGSGRSGVSNGSSGGGGSSAGTGSIGNNAPSAPAGGSAVVGGGAGGAGAENNFWIGINGSAGSIPGGGGGGGVGGLFSDGRGGNGGNGQIRITYCRNFTITSLSNNGPICGSAGSATVTVSSTPTGLPVGNYTVTYNTSSQTGQTTSMNVTTAGTGTFSVGGMPTSGTSTVTVTGLTSGSCITTGLNSSTTITITAVPTISYSAVSFCKTLTVAQPVTRTGVNGGSYSSTPSGLSLNISTGAIIPSTSTVGTYTVAYAYSASGGCPLGSATTSVTINAAPLGGSISGATAVCSGTNSTVLTLSGHSGTIVRWESSLDNFATAGTSVTNSSATYTASNLTATTSYRAVLGNGVCTPVTSGVATVTVNANNTVVLNSATGTDAQTRCINTAITNIRYNTTGATSATVTGLPDGVTGSWSGNVVTISGTPTESSATPYTYTVTLNGGCGTVTATGTIRVNPINTVSLTSAAGTNAQTACINTPISNITYSTTGATSATVTGLPDGVTGSWSGNVVTISGTPTVSSATPYSYTVTLNGGCGTVTTTGTIRVNPTNTITLTSATGTDAQSICFNSAITDITYATTGGTLVAISGFPTGLNITWSGSVFRISGTPNVSSASPYNYTVALQGNCATVTLSGTITVKPLPTAPTITKNHDAACNTLGSITITGLSGNWTVNQTGATTLPQSYPGPGASLAIQDLAADTYSFTVTDNTTGCTSSPATVTITDTSSNTEWDATGWTNGEPDGSKSVTISYVTASHQPFTIAKPNIAACSLTITATSNVIVPDGVTLTITNKVTSNGKLVFESGSSLLQTTNVKNGGDIVYKRTTKINRFDLTYWSSPVTGELDTFKMKDLSSETLFDKFFTYSPTGGWATSMYGMAEMERGKGYSIRGPQSFDTQTPADFTGEFKGRPNNGDITVPSVVPDKWFLLGNPYPSAIDVDALWDANKDVLGALYFWTHVAPPTKAPGDNTYRYASNDYAVYTASGGTVVGGTKAFDGFIAAGQGFFVRPKTTEIHFNNDMRRGSSVNGTFYKVANKSKSIERNRIWLNMVNNEGAFKQILVGYIEGATNNVDFNYDAPTISGNSYLDFYSLNETKKLTIQGRALPFENTDLVPLGYKTTVAGDFTIGIDHGDGFFAKQEIYLEDKTTGKTINLRNENYTFSTLVGTFTDRFVLRYTGKTLGTDDLENLENSVLVSLKNKTISITCSKETIKDVTIFNVGAQLVYSKNKVNSSELQITNLHSSDQVLLVKVTLENGSTVTKKVIFSNL